MYASNKSGLSDPYAKVSFHRYSLTSRVIKQNVSPTWDQTLVISEVKIYEEGSNITSSPPPVVMQFYNKDRIVSRKMNFDCVPSITCLHNRFII